MAFGGGQIGNATGQDSGTFTYTGGGGIQIHANYVNCGIPGGHTGTANYPGLGSLVRNTDGPCSSGVKGVVLFRNWNEIEPTTQGVYVWDALDADVAACIELGVQYVVVLVVRTFTSTNNPAPAYLNSLPYVIQYTAGVNVGYQMSRWDPTVQAGFRGLVNAIGARYDSVANFEGIATQETSVGMTAAQQTATGFTQPAFLTGLELESDYILSACPTSRHFGFQNFMPADQIGNSVADGRVRLSAYMQYMAASHGSIGGGPDILPDNAALQPEVYQRYVDVAATAPPNNGPLMCSAQNDTFTQATRTLTQIFQWSTGTTLSGPALPGTYIQSIHLDYMFWNWHISGGGPNFFNPDARLVIAANPSGWHYYNP